MAHRAPARGLTNAYAAAKVVTMNLLDLTPRQLKRAAPIKNRSTNLKKENSRLTILPDVLSPADRVIK
jgi:hypothetical protein